MTKGNTICPRPFHGGGIKIMLEWTELEEMHIKPGEVRFNKLLIKGAGLA
jgi:hypothetical protein